MYYACIMQKIGKLLDYILTILKLGQDTMAIQWTKGKLENVTYAIKKKFDSRKPIYFNLSLPWISELRKNKTW